MARYKATARGFAGRLIESGEVFTYNGEKGSWMEEVQEGGGEGEDLDEEELPGEGGGDYNLLEKVKAALDELGINPGKLRELLDKEEQEDNGDGGDGGDGGEGGGENTPDRETIKAALTTLKVEFNPRAPTDKLQELLDAKMKEAEQ